MIGPRWSKMGYKGRCYICWVFQRLDLRWVLVAVGTALHVQYPSNQKEQEPHAEQDGRLLVDMRQRVRMDQVDLSMSAGKSLREKRRAERRRYNTFRIFVIKAPSDTKKTNDTQTVFVCTPIYLPVEFSSMSQMATPSSLARCRL